MECVENAASKVNGVSMTTDLDLDIDELLNKPRAYSSYRRNIALESSPDFTKRLEPFCEVPVGVPVVLECRVSAFPVARVRWYMDDQEVFPDHPRYILDTDTLHGVIQSVYFGLSAVNGLSSMFLQNTGKLRRFCDILFASIAFPLSIFVAATFWILYAIDRELVYPKFLDGIIPVWVNHVNHSTIAVFAFVELIFIEHKLPSKCLSLTLTLGLSLAYLTWILYIGVAKNIWVYGVLEVLDWNGRAAFIAGCLVLVTIINLLGRAIHSTVWASNEVVPKKSKKKK